MSVCTKERKGDTAEVLMATPCTNSLGGESEGQKHEEDDEGCGAQACDVREEWILLKLPRGDIDGVGEVK